MFRYSVLFKEMCIKSSTFFLSVVSNSSNVYLRNNNLSQTSFNQRKSIKLNQVVQTLVHFFSLLFIFYTSFNTAAVQNSTNNHPWTVKRQELNVIR